MYLVVTDDYCDRCNLKFYYHNSHKAHLETSPNHNICNTCDKDFPTWVGLKEHWVQSPMHSYCQYCDEHYDNRIQLDDHLEQCHPWCGQCRKMFVNQLGLHEHRRQSPMHDYCAPCKKLFQSGNNLKNHLLSAAHQPKTIKCLLSLWGCNTTFVSRGALSAHLESGKCASGIDRKTVKELVKRLDTNNLITDRQLTYGQSEHEIRYMATDAAWNGSGYECYFCTKTNSSLNALNQHYGSSAHAEKTYVCRYPRCLIKFSTLSGLVQHIDSQKCGVAKFSVVQNTMDSVLGQMRGLTL